VPASEKGINNKPHENSRKGNEGLTQEEGAKGREKGPNTLQGYHPLKERILAPREEDDTEGGEATGKIRKGDPENRRCRCQGAHTSVWRRIRTTQKT